LKGRVGALVLPQELRDFVLVALGFLGGNLEDALPLTYLRGEHDFFFFLFFSLSRILTRFEECFEVRRGTVKC
jgi:hypothetical protein